jgi:hypothetical protein
MRFEIDHLKMAESVICGAREEQWLLAGFGLRPGFLPMYPAGRLREHLLSLRLRRQSVPADHVLVLSSFSNPPNRAGVLRLADMLVESRPKAQVILAGNGSERFREQVGGDIMTIEGTVSQERLDELLVGAKAVLIYQSFGTGALTRIPEALTAGIPVFCNSVAARSALQYSGVYTFESASELAELMEAYHPIPPPPAPPVLDEHRFVAVVRSALGVPKAAGRPQ